MLTPIEIAWREEGAGVAEIAGIAANKRIIAYFHGIGRTDITSDEIYWCAAAYFWCLTQAGISVDHIPPEKRLLAVSALLVGTRIKQPRVGCGVVMKRPGGHHVAFVKSWTATTIELTGGNQADSFCTREFKRTADMVFMWPYPEASASQVAALGSRTAKAATRQVKDAGKTTAVQGAPVPPPGASRVVESTHALNPDALVAKGSSLQTVVERLESFAMFAWGKWPWIAAAFALYWVARMAYDAWLIRKYRAEDHNTGANVEQPKPAPLPPELELTGEEVNFA